MFVERVLCPACGGRTARTLFRRAYADPSLFEFLRSYYRLTRDSASIFADAVFHVDECEACGTAYQRFVPAPALLTRLYDEWLNSDYHPDGDPMVAEGLARPQQSRDGHELLAASVACRRPLREMRVLDYGMGWGLWGQVAARMGAKSYGFDLSPARCDYAADRGVAVVGEHDIEGGAFDFINADQVFEHLTDPASVARTLARGLRSGGILKISVPRAADLEERLQVADWQAPRTSPNSLKPIMPLEHLNCFGPDGLRRLTGQPGLRPVRPAARAYFRFLRTGGAIPWRSARALAKAFARPLYHRFSRDNLYMWFQRPA